MWWRRRQSHSRSHRQNLQVCIFQIAKSTVHSWPCIPYENFRLPSDTDSLSGWPENISIYLPCPIWTERSYFEMHDVGNRYETRIWETSPWLSILVLVVTSLQLRKLSVLNCHKSVRSKAFSSDHIVLLSWFFFICMAVKIEGFSIDSFDVQH